MMTPDWPSLDSQQPLFNEQVIMVTGAGRGIGRALALALARRGATLILCGRTLEHLESIYDQICCEKLAEPLLLPLDFKDLSADQCALVADAIGEQFGRLDALVHNASELGPLTSLSQYPVATFDQLMQVNVRAALMLSQALLPLLQQATSGRLLFTSSSVGRNGRAYWGGYSISKFATEGMMQIFADELENTSSVRVMCINPGATRTDMRARAYPAEDPQRLPNPEDILPCYLQALSAAGAAWHGQSIDAQPRPKGGQISQ